MSASRGSNQLPRVTFNPQPQAFHSTVQMPSSFSTMGGLQQHQQYPGINNIPGMQSLNHIGGVSNVQNLQTQPSVQSYSSLPGVSAMPSLLHPPAPSETIVPPPSQGAFSHSLPPPSQPGSSHPPTSLPPSTNSQATDPGASGHAAGLSSSFLSNHFASSNLLSGAVEKPRKSRKTRSLPVGLLGGNDSSPMMGHRCGQFFDNADGCVSSNTPVYEADGIQFKILDQLPDAKIHRLRSEKIKPIEQLTFSDIKAYNRNQLRAYCSVYGIRRKKKADMERDMARYAALFHPNDAEYDLNKFEPTEYAEGPIPRRRVPVTKQQKEKAAGDFKQLTNALHQRPSSGLASSGITSPGMMDGGQYTGIGTQGGHEIYEAHGAPAVQSGHPTRGVHDAQGIHTGHEGQHLGRGTHGSHVARGGYGGYDFQEPHPGHTGHIGHGSIAGHGLSGGGGGFNNGPLAMGARVPDIHGTSAHAGSGLGVGGNHHTIGGVGHHQVDENEADGGGGGHPELISVPEMHVPQHLLPCPEGDYYPHPAA